MVSKDDPRVARCAFARLVGDNVDFLMRKYSIIMGRKSKNSTSDLILGDQMSLSRQHARLYYDFDNKQFCIEALGKNGFTVNGLSVEPGAGPVPLASPSLLQLGEISLYFLLPRSTAVYPPKAQHQEQHQEPTQHADQSNAAIL